LLGRDVGDQAEAAFISRCAFFDVRPPTGEDFERMAALMEQYSEYPLGTWMHR